TKRRRLGERARCDGGEAVRRESELAQPPDMRGARERQGSIVAEIVPRQVEPGHLGKDRRLREPADGRRAHRRRCETERLQLLHWRLREGRYRVVSQLTALEPQPARRDEASKERGSAGPKRVAREHDPLE